MPSKTRILLHYNRANDPNVSMPPVKSTGLRFIDFLGFAGAGLLAVLGIWPGWVIGCYSALLILLAGILCVAWLVTFIVVSIGAEARNRRMVKRQLLVLPATVCLTLLLVENHLMQRLVFSTVHSRFAAMIASAPVVDFQNGSRPPKPVDRWIGPYHLIEYAADARGGVFFLTGRGGDGIGPDMTSYGFVYQPNSQGSPFGRKYYNPVHLFGDWYMFEASDEFLSARRLRNA
jgi:hypothetical protein